VDPIRFGRGIRALRQRRRWRQEDLARDSRLSQAVVSRIELGQLNSIPLSKLILVARALGAEVDLRLQWQGERLDRLVDAAHASLVEQVVRLMTTWGWETLTEVSFSIYGERGAIDVLARHVEHRRLAVIEVKSAIGDVQGTLSALDRKVRNASIIARGRGSAPWPPARLLVVADASTARRRVAEHAATFGTVLPLDSRAVRRWLREPEAPAIGGVWFLSPTRRAGIRRRVRTSTPRITPRHSPDGYATERRTPASPTTRQVGR
jgi:transcriptional regulator with XRE-family HTH domain